MTIVATTYTGSEYMYHTGSIHRVSKQNAGRICDALNAARYNLTDGEKWKIYNVKPGTFAHYAGTVQAFQIRAGHLYET